MGAGLTANGGCPGAFYYGYICTNLLGGVLCRHCGAKTVLRWSMAGWSLSTIMLPWAADR